MGKLKIIIFLMAQIRKKITGFNKDLDAKKCH